ncbi:hypothetical protein CPT_Moonbeam119 [Bacillus phage Moonbeam]|uniref:Uncharacterized protein n=1 Tax=Bacillus phage Moonbeam TaxID=1540091 RepID=A0A0A0RNE5_9CAUD|nr:hypothetical protein CPT_Moonbeam119 [Bacillus phage Moonbeam]AIW03517.1 hypothetical protein CPT_Moonbeam119 [Bacillus phage Moonbeam]
MGVHTTYDEMRDRLREQLDDCLRDAKAMFDEDIWGYHEMRSEYIIDVYQAIKRARDEV